MDALNPSTRLLWRVCLWFIFVIMALSAPPVFDQTPGNTSQPQSYVWTCPDSMDHVVITEFTVLGANLQTNTR